MAHFHLPAPDVDGFEKPGAKARELGPREYAYVATEQDTSSRAPDSLPHLIKLHGTLSRPETLRFTRTATASLPPSIMRPRINVVIQELQRFGGGEAMSG